VRCCATSGSNVCPAHGSVSCGSMRRAQRPSQAARTLATLNGSLVFSH